MKSNHLPPILYEIVLQVRGELCRLRDIQTAPLTESLKEQLVVQAAERLGVVLSSFERDEILAELSDELPLFGMLQPLIEDSTVSDIILSSSSSIAVQRGRRNILTDCAFQNQQEYERFVERLLIRSGSMYSTRTPIVDAMIGENIRIHAVHRSIATNGPYVTIRVNRFSMVTIEDLLDQGLGSSAMFSYLQSCIENQATILIAGEVSTGKTTLLRALAAEVDLRESLIVIEDTPEISINHPLIRYLQTREDNNEQQGKIPAHICIKAAMRMAMNRVILGEIRDAAAAEAFIDAASSGHPGLSTIHARDIAETLVRLQLFLSRAQPSVPRETILEQVGTAVQVLVQLQLCPYTAKRRICSIAEISSSKEGVIQVNEVFRYSFNGDPQWRVVSSYTHHASQKPSYEDKAYRLPQPGHPYGLQ